MEEAYRRLCLRWKVGSHGSLCSPTPAYSKGRAPAPVHGRLPVFYDTPVVSLFPLHRTGEMFSNVPGPYWQNTFDGQRTGYSNSYWGGSEHPVGVDHPVRRALLHISGTTSSCAIEDCDGGDVPRSKLLLSCLLVPQRRQDP